MIKLTKAKKEDQNEDKNENNGDIGQNADTDVNSDNSSDQAEENIVISRQKIAIMKRVIENIRENNERLIELLSVYADVGDEQRIQIGQMSENGFTPTETETNRGTVIEGVFDGENMIGPDGKQYSVPANYASKSKLVEGDILKLTISSSGTFMYKQIGPIERKRVIGQLEQTTSGGFIVTADGRKWQVLTASVTYFKGLSGDEAVILVPKSGDSKWGALENIVKRSNA
jgi:hypothetical protein